MTAEEVDVNAAAAALAAATNKDIDAAVVGALNALLGIEVDPAIEAAVAEAVAEGQ